MRTIVFAVLLSACYRYAFERGPQPTRVFEIDQAPSVVVTRDCVELDRDRDAPHALYVLCSPDDPETAARLATRGP